MTVVWTSEQVLALSPDTGSTQNGKSFANVAKWVSLGRSEQAVWGECKGSSKKPYRTQIDLSEPAFRCTCPSRKFPCKHALGLFLLLTEQPNAFTSSSPPDWVAEWLAKRSQTAEQKQAKQKQATADPIAQAKRAERRTVNVEAGLVDLSQWLQDMLRHGLATLPNQPYTFWDQTAARLMDAQAPGLARRVRLLAGIPHSGEGWPERMLQALGQLHLLVQGYHQLASLPPDLQAEVRSQIGWTYSQEELRLRAQKADPLVACVADRWQILGRVITEEENLQMQRVWLWGEATEKMALVLNFAHGRNPLDLALVPGSSFAGKLIFYPGAGVRRAFIEVREALSAQLPNQRLGFDRIDTAITHYAQTLSQNPWLGEFPVVLRQVLPHRQANTWWLQDAEGRVLPLATQFSQGWELVAVSGGWPLTVFGEWNGSTLLPLSLWTETQFIVLGGAR